MSDIKRLHIISHDVPWPADYGGVVDLFYKVKSLHNEGVKIILHCFKNPGREEQEELNHFCEKVYYYDRLRGLRGLSFTLPYIVKSRAHPDLLVNLLKDNHPVFMEGIHCTAFLHHLLNQNRKVYLRLHNVEALYYSHLFRHEKNWFKKIYFLNESVFLGKYEKRLPTDLPMFSLSLNDADYFRDVYEKKNVRHLPIFIPDQEIRCPEGKGGYCLYHGNLGVIENEKAALWLLKKVFSKTKIPFVIAGRNPTDKLIRRVERSENCRLVNSPDDDALKDIISNAQIHVLPSLNKTGIKLKLINALYNGRHCVVNEAAAEGSGLEEACHIGKNSVALLSIITQLYHQPFTEEEINLRKRLLPSLFDNKRTAQQLIQWIW